MPDNQRRITVTVSTFNRALLYSLQKDPPAGARVTIPSTREHKALGFETLLYAIIDLSWQVDVGLFATWLYQKVSPQKEKTKLEINSIEVVLEENEIRRVLVEQVKQESGS